MSTRFNFLHRKLKPSRKQKPTPRFLDWILSLDWEWPYSWLFPIPKPATKPTKKFINKASNNTLEDEDDVMKTADAIRDIDNINNSN